MPAWATVLLTLGSTAICATAALTASWMQLRSARANIGRRWWRTRDELLVFGAVDASSNVASAANSLADAVAATWTSVLVLNSHPSSADDLQMAVANHAEARGAADRVGQLLRA